MNLQVKNESENESSDEEPPPGELDKPIVILYEKRAKKEVKRFNPIEKEPISVFGFFRSFDFQFLKIGQRKKKKKQKMPRKIRPLLISLMARVLRLKL